MFDQIIETISSVKHEGLKASAIIGRQHIVSLFPSVYKGYFYITHFESRTGIYEYLGKPVQQEYLAEVLTSMGINANDGQWTVQECKPLAESPYVEEHSIKRPESLVYFIEGAGCVKIGVAEYPEERLETLQIGSPVSLRLLATCKGGYKKETELHTQFAHLRLHGEWFALTPELLNIIGELG